MMDKFNNEEPAAGHPFSGTWTIYEIELWDSDYFNMEVQAYINIGPDNLGSFQFGLVSGYLDGYIEDEFGQKLFFFTWEGQDEMDQVTGSGWMKQIDENEMAGSIKLHLGDRSSFSARRAT